MTVPGTQVEVLESAATDGSDGDSAGEPVHIRLGVWISNTKSRRAKLTADAADKPAQLRRTRRQLGLNP